MNTVAFIGLGQMGSGMAARLLAAGHALHLYDRTAERAHSLERLGARLFATPAQACAGADAIISMVSDDTASQAIWCGADTADLAAARGLLEAFAQHIFHFGAVGTGTAYKLIINMLGAVQIASAAECMAIAERAGLDLRTVANAIATGQAASPQVVRNSQRMVAGDYLQDVVFTPKLRLKDVSYALQLTQSVGIGAPFGLLAEAAFRQLCQMGYQGTHESAIMEVARLQTPNDDRPVAGPSG